MEGVSLLINLIAFGPALPVTSGYPAFNSDFRITKTDKENRLQIAWKKDFYKAILNANLSTYHFV